MTQGHGSVSKREAKRSSGEQRIILENGERESTEKQGRGGEGRGAENHKASPERALSWRPTGTVAGTETVLPRVADVAEA